MLKELDCKHASCQPDKARARFSDEGNLYLEVSRNGSKRWFWKYWRADGKESRLALGAYPEVSLKAARMARDSARVHLKMGTDPVQDRQMMRLIAEVSLGDTFLDVAQDWLSTHKDNWSPAHFVRESRNVSKDLGPILGKRKISTIEPQELLAVIRKVEQRGALSTAGRVHITANSIWGHAVATGKAQRNIAPDISKGLKPHIRRNYPAIIDPVELAKLLRDSLNYQGGPVVKAALLIAPILFQRPGNLRTMKWTHLDLKKGFWSIPSADMKRRKHEKINGQPHVVPLPSQAIKILSDLMPITGRSLYVFPGQHDSKKSMSEAAVNAALHDMGYKGRQTWHSYRATGRTLIREQFGYDTDIIEAQLAHTGQITHGGAYDRATHKVERTKMLQEWADYLDKIAGD